MPHLAIIIVSYNTRDLLRNCLRSICTSGENPNARMNTEVIVVDNASSDGTIDMLRTEFPQVTLIASQENLGFTKGNNLALRRLGFEAGGSADKETGRQEDKVSAGLGEGSLVPDFVLLLNPDTEVVGDALRQMVSALQSSTEAGACGAHLQFGDGTFQHGAFRFSSWTQVLLDLFPFYAIRGMHRLYAGGLNGRYPASSWNGSQPFSVDFVLGASLMLKSEVIAATGLLDEGFFMYCEEMDWCLRVKKAGWTVLAVPTAKIIHHEGQSSKQVRWQSFVHLWQSRFRFYQKHADQYPALERWLIRRLVWLNFAWRKRQTQNREEVAAYEQILQKLQ